MLPLDVLEGFECEISRMFWISGREGREAFNQNGIKYCALIKEGPFEIRLHL